MDTDILLPCSQEQATGLYPAPAYSSPQVVNSVFFTSALVMFTKYFVIDSFHLMQFGSESTRGRYVGRSKDHISKLVHSQSTEVSVLFFSI
jgi:hypothetical protein